MAILQGSLKKRDKWLRQFLVSSVQSYLCNRYLAERVGMGAFDRLLAGISPEIRHRRLFDVVDLDQEQPRYQAQGDQLYGAALWAGDVGSRRRQALEDKVLAQSGLTMEDFGRARQRDTAAGTPFVSDLGAQPCRGRADAQHSQRRLRQPSCELMKADAALDEAEEAQRIRKERRGATLAHAR